MANRNRRRLVIGALCIALVSPAFAFAQSYGGGYDRGYREGVEQGERDWRDGEDPRELRFVHAASWQRGGSHLGRVPAPVVDEMRRASILGETAAVSRRPLAAIR